MISRNTPPGTKIVCINVSEIPINIGFMTVFMHTAYDLVLGQEYTLREIKPLESIPCGPNPDLFVCRVEEMQGCWLTVRFRRRDLPEKLTSLLQTSREPAGTLT